MPAASILIKPVSSRCNIDCRYCFYKKLTGKRAEADYGKMSLQTAEMLVKHATDYADGFVCFAFQGGEPTLAGLDFYREIVRLQKQYNTKGLEIQNTIQTNGTLIDEEWAEFLHENHFLVGLSLDGGRRVNDMYRVDYSGQGVYASIMRTVELFRRYNVDFNIVSVVTSLSAKKVPFIYHFYKEQGFDYIQFVPCLDENGEDLDYCLGAEEYGDFLNELFDLWYEDFMQGVRMDIRMFSNLAQMAAGYEPEECGMSGHCTTYFVVEGDGSVYPCDFYAVDEWRLGTVADSFKSMYEGERSQCFMGCSGTLHEKCAACPYRALCRGGCRRWREPVSAEHAGLHCLCAGYEKFFAHCQERIYRLGQLIRENHS